MMQAEIPTCRDVKREKNLSSKGSTIETVVNVFLSRLPIRNSFMAATLLPIETIHIYLSLLLHLYMK